MERISEIASKVNQGESKFSLESWNQKAKDSFLKKEFKKVFKENQDNEIPTLTVPISFLFNDL
jgi:hypothetical protein